MSIKPEPGTGPGGGLPPSSPFEAGAEPREPHPSNLQQIASATSPELLEGATIVGLKALESLKPPLDAVSSLNTTQAAQWLKAINDLKSRAKPTRTIVGVVGNTGAGKSSVISAVLDEERLLPTNCMRACTASPTEISYNYSEDPNELYRAEVEFITAEDWKKELESLFMDLIDGNGDISRECANADTEAGIAYAKIKAVYPKKTKEMIKGSTSQGLVNEPPVRRVLGSIKTLRATLADSIYKQLQEYVDSKEKNTEKTMEYWPLIKVVRIFTKAKALATGACLVDLPGVQDSNAARAAIAANYMKACTGLWIVAPITRAVDDKTAKSLLGDSFRRQLKYDGFYSAVTFICSKTDDISIIEAADSLGLDQEIDESQGRVDTNQYRIRQLKGQISDLRDEKDTLDDLIDAIDQTWETWEALGKKLSKGKTVYAPQVKSPSNKRKRKAKPRGARKNRQSVDSDEDSDDISDTEMSGDSDKENDQPEEVREPLTEEDIDRKLAELKAQKRELRARKKAKDEEMAGIRAEAKRLEAETKTLQSEIKAVCIKGRNAYSREAIKKDFAMGIKELDQEAAAQQDEDTFDPEVDIRDYDAVARSLPVFCVSSRAFQSLSGRLKKDNINHSGFLSLEDTEVPQLQAHAKKLTEGSRLATSRRFLNDLMQLVNSMKMWAANDGSQSALCDRDKKKEEACLRQRLQQVETDFMAAIKECSTALNEAMSENIYDYFDRTIPMAIEAAVPTATSWGAPRVNGVGGLLYATYKATCRRSGVFNGASGPRDFNEELFDPISKQLAGGWEKAFQRRLPSCINNFVRTAKLLIETFHREAIQTTQERGSNANGIHMLNNQLRALLQRVTDLPNIVNLLVQEMQRDSSRSFTPEIMHLMQPGYDRCVEERGPGSYARMKAHMINHVDLIRRTMFRGATNVVRNQLQDLGRKISDQLFLQMQELHARLSHDYLAALFGADIAKVDGIPRAERMLRSEMIPLLEAVDSQFEHLVPKSETKPETKPEDVPVDGLPQLDGADDTPQYEEADYDNGDMDMDDVAARSFTPAGSPPLAADDNGSRPAVPTSSVTPAAELPPPEFNKNNNYESRQPQSDTLPFIKEEPF
ncbi:nuclear GTPase SLIP-GC [Podospora aff. communis PSN243]|uniref:Nuclear GTPase SLIP-GC n=1 Tax=Podospora aff. communis PSN243 TaxID=3040156 RepID=A0AAV9G4F0_9PEZI|nr:nuclear GTPase SLIP-GC [Podospora aff. communis PSN243]